MIVFRKLSFWLACLGIVASVSLVLRMRGALLEPVPPPAVTPPTKPFAKGIGASGLVESIRENTLIGVPQAGLVTTVHVKVWDRVEAGQPLLQLDDRELNATLGAQRAQIAVSEASLARLREQLARLDAIGDARAISAEEIKTRRSDVAVAAAQVEAARATVVQTEALLARLTVRAPIAGTILQVNIRVGEYAAPTAASAPLVLGAIDEVQVRADVDEQLAPRVRAGAKAVGYIKGAASEAIPLEFIRIEPFVVPKRSLTGSSTERVDTRVLQVIYKFPNTLKRPVYVGQQMDLFIEE
ncbi:MAG: efflux RND transporter periplasmic adaptor subunit [Verrucomicrobiota bacterium]